MTKQELMENYTMEQLADMLVNASIELDVFKYRDHLLKSDNFNNHEVALYETEAWFKYHKNAIMQSEVDKYRKAFEDAKKERDCQIAEYRKKIEELYYPLKTLEGNLKVSNMIIEETIKNENGEDSNTVKFSSIKQFAEYIKCFYTVNLDYIQKVLRGNEESQNNFENITDFLPTEPIKVADMLINAGGEYEHNPIVKKICGTDKGTYRIFEISELRQIAEYLIVYCNHHEEAQE